MIIVESRRKKLDTIHCLYPNAAIVDVTSKGEIPWVRFSPFYPHGDIPVPFSPDVKATSVEGIWQALKVFAKADIDISKLSIITMAGLKRTTRTYGPVLGHRTGLNGNDLLGYREARLKIYLPSYLWVLENKLSREVGELKTLAKERDLILLDYETNCDINDLSRPLSHVSLIVAYINDAWPDAKAKE